MMTGYGGHGVFFGDFICELYLLFDGKSKIVENSVSSSEVFRPVVALASNV